MDYMNRGSEGQKETELDRKGDRVSGRLDTAGSSE